MTNKFSAKPSASGYIYQIQSALLLLLKSKEESAICIEALDDVSFEDSGTPIELLQMKYHRLREANLTDYSPDLWKTIRVWSDHLGAGLITFPGISLSLITTATAPPGSIAACLRHDSRENREELCSRLVRIAQTSASEVLIPAFKSFMALGAEHQQALIDAICVLDNAPSLDAVRSSIREFLGLGIRSEHLAKVHERLDGWWMEQTITQLRSGEGKNIPITRLEAAAKIADIADEYRPDSLPIEFEEAVPATGPTPDSDDRLFIKQLRAIGVSTKRIEKAILDYYRATEQRSKWVREDLIVDSELARYERRLVDEWERFSAACFEKLTDLQKNEVRVLEQCGQRVFDHFEFEADIRIRQRVTAAYIMRGSFHILANLLPPKVYWHPTFLDRIKDLIAEVETR